jgi:hypothetical protein
MIKSSQHAGRDLERPHDPGERVQAPGGERDPRRMFHEPMHSVSLERQGFVSGCRALAHEAWYTSGEPRNPDVHSSAAQAADIAQRAGVERLLLIHMPPFAGDVSALAAEARGIVAGAEVAVDGGDFSRLMMA